VVRDEQYLPSNLDFRHRLGNVETSNKASGRGCESRGKESLFIPFFDDENRYESGLYFLWNVDTSIQEELGCLCTSRLYRIVKRFLVRRLELSFLISVKLRGIFLLRTAYF
jgi:hypothetical protein